MNIKIMRGVPGSGKSTWAKNLRQVTYDQGLLPIIVSADMYFTASGQYMFDPTKLGEAHRWCMSSFINSCNDHMNPIIVDNTNINLEDISPYVAVGEALGYDVEIVQIETDPEIAAARNTHGVPKAKVIEMARRMQVNRIPRRWNVVVVKP